MKRLLFYIFSPLLVLYIFVFDTASQSLPVLGWAKNSVNTPVFRKNSVVSFKGTQFTAYYDSAGYVILAKRKSGSDLWNSAKTQYKGNVNDAHCSISITVDGEGYLHMAWDHHNNALRYCKSIAPDTLVLSDKMSMIGSQENDVTYPEFFKLPNGDLLFMYRYGISGNGNLIINKFNLSEKKWYRLHDVLIDGQGQRNAYWQSCVDAKGTIHVSWVWRETWDVATNHDLCYAKSTDGGISWQKSNGEVYTLPITLETAEYVCKIQQSSELINQTSIYADSHGKAYIASYWRPEGKTVPQYHIVYFNGTRWITQQASNRKTAFSLSGGGTKKIPVSRPQLVVDDRNDTSVVYLIYRDIERNNRVSVNMTANLDSAIWFVYDLTDFPVESWEPSYDTELWKDSVKLNVFVQKVGQGDGEGLESYPPQPVYIIEMPSSFIPVDTFAISKPVVQTIQKKD